MSTYLYESWSNTINHYQCNGDEYYNDLIKRYLESSRHYHNLDHIIALLKLTDEYAYTLSNPHLLRLAIWYHDAVYDATKKDNEEQSAALAKAQLYDMGMDSVTIQDCCDMIIATKTHVYTGDKNQQDTNFLLDIDLSILAVSTDEYSLYTQQIRQEYQMFPDTLYNTGRIAVLKHFLSMDKIYQTDTFYDIWEEQARRNITSELLKLGQIS